MQNNLGSPRPADGNLAIVGAGASAREVAWLARQCWGNSIRITHVVTDPSLLDDSVNGLPIRHIDEFARAFPGTAAVIAIGDPAARERCAGECLRSGFRFVSLVHPRVEASDLVTIGAGTVICAGTVLTTNIKIGNHVHINVGCTVSHDAELSDFATLSPGVHISGWVHLGRRAFLGTGCSVINGSRARPIRIGDDALVGTGASVINDIAPGKTVVGVPATRELS